MIHQGLLYTDGRLNLLIGTPPDTDPIHNGWRRTSNGEAWASFDGPIKYRWNGLCFTEKGAVLVTPDSPPKSGDYKAWGGVRVSNSGHMYLATSGGSKAGGRRLKNDGTLVVEGIGYVKDFISSPGQTDGLTFSGGANGTRVNEEGLIEAAVTPRIDYDPVTLAPKGLLIEEARTNLALRSEEFDNAYWTKTRSSISADEIVAPDGETTADLLTEDDTASSTHTCQRTFTKAGSALAYSVSIYVKPNGRTWCGLQLQDGSNSATAYLNCSGSGSVGTLTSNGTWATPTATITAYPDGWYRCTMTTTSSTSTTLAFIHYLATANGTVSYSGDETSGQYIWGAQLEQASAPSSYIKTEASSVTRTADSATDTTIAWYNQSEGTIVVEADTGPLDELVKGIVGLGDGTANERYTLFKAVTSGNIQLTVIDGGAVQVAMSAGAASAGVNKAAYAYKVNDFGISRNGGSVVTDTSATLPTVTTLYIGDNALGTKLNGHIRRLTYYNTRLANDILQKLSA